ncbi:MAG: hypothetical protein PHW08_07140 [Kiritimatiellae bacterium]|nr:hypothetical protein [Kiritimatiellia bacterium]
MKLNIAKGLYEADWHEFGEGVRLKIRPYPASRAAVTLKAGALVISGAESFEMFDYCLVDWEGVVGADDKPLKATAEIKRSVFDWRLGEREVDGERITITDFVLKTARRLAAAIEGDEKN